MPGGLTRVAAATDARYIAMQRGGSSKDTWVLSDNEVSSFSLLKRQLGKADLIRSGSNLSSRVVENLYWFGRYSERCEDVARLLRVGLSRLVDAGTDSAPALASAIDLCRSLKLLLKRLDNAEVDDYTTITTLIGVEFDDNTVWGQLTILELKLLIHLALKKYDDAKELVEMFLQYNDNTVERGLFYQALNVVLEVLLDDDLELADYEANFRRMFGDARMDAVIGSVEGSVRFHGLTPTSLKLEGLDRHQRLIDSYRKLHTARARLAA